MFQYFLQSSKDTIMKLPCMRHFQQSYMQLLETIIFCSLPSHFPETHISSISFLSPHLHLQSFAVEIVQKKWICHETIRENAASSSKHQPKNDWESLLLKKTSLTHESSKSNNRLALNHCLKSTQDHKSPVEVEIGHFLWFSQKKFFEKRIYREHVHQTECWTCLSLLILATLGPVIMRFLLPRRERFWSVDMLYVQ